MNIKKLTTTVLAGAAGLVLAGGAMAGEPLRLTAEQLDQVTGAARLRVKVQLSWAAATSDALANGGTSANISTSNSASTSDTLNSSETSNTSGSTTTLSTTSTRTASSATSANASGTGSVATGNGYSSAGDLLLKIDFKS
jgi:hypothetical protein